MRRFSWLLVPLIFLPSCKTAPDSARNPSSLAPSSLAPSVLEATQSVARRSIPASYGVTWPWPNARRTDLARGVAHFHDVGAPDGTTLDLLVFDFAANSKLRFGLFDADAMDSDDAKSRWREGPNRFAYWKNGPGVLAKRLNQNRDLVAAWNGAYWGLLNRKPREADRSFHLSPVVLDGQVLYRGINRRWTWGARIVKNRPHFSLWHEASSAQLQTLDFATGTMQALLKDGKPLEIAPYPAAQVKPHKLGLPSTPREAGAIWGLDHMHTSRVGAGWTNDGKLLVLIVKEPDGEAPSRALFNARKPGKGGWTLDDHQDFWRQLQKLQGVQNAVGLDGGDVAQALFRRPDGDFTLLVPRIATPKNQNATQRLQSQPAFSTPNVRKLRGGALNLFYITQSRD